MRIAYFSPVPPVRSGIADYSEALLPHLAQHAEVELFVDGYEPAGEEIRRVCRTRDWREFEEEHARGRYHNVLYHIGNNPYHVSIYDMALRVPGVVMLHEFNLHYLLADVTIVRNDWEGYFRELEYNGGSEAMRNAERIRSGEIEPEYERYAMNRRLLETSRAAIVHSDYMVRLIRAGGHSLPAARIPHGVRAAAVDAEAVRARLGLGNQPVAGAFGFLKPYKRVYSVLHALARLRGDFPDARLLLVGEEHPHYPLRPLIRELGLEQQVSIMGFVPLEDFTSYMACCDVCLNLRYPTAGESSGSLLREMAAGKAVIVSDIGPSSELPDDACIKIPPGEGEVDWLVEYLEVLWNCPELRREIGENARRWTTEVCDWAKTAEKYAAFLCEHSLAAQAHAPRASPAAPPGPSQPPVEPHAAADYILSFGLSSRPVEDYVRLHLNRLVHTLEITPPARHGASSVLEMGCYMQLTPALRHFLGYQHIRGCYYGRAGSSHEKMVYSTGGEEFSCRIDLFDAEKDGYPYPDASFDTVLCCELVEHLYFDPMHLMAEINRILKPGGHLVLTTPNIAAARGLLALLHGFHPGLFHTYVVPKNGGEVDPRHNREYAPRDVRALLEKAGFEVLRLETGWLEADAESRYLQLDQLLAEKGYSRELRGDIIYAVGQKVGPIRERYPVELYTAF